MEVAGFIYFLAFLNLGESLECYVCHSRQNSECGDPFPLGNTTGNMIPFDCEHVRNVGMATVLASGALGGVRTQFMPLQQPPHVCYKMSVGDLAVRGCSKSDICQNITGFCDICDTDGCNGAGILQSLIIPLLLPCINLIIF